MDSVDRLVIDFDIWFKRTVLRYNDTRNCLRTLWNLADTPERKRYVLSRFGKAPCPTCGTQGFIDDVTPLEKVP